MKLRTYQIDVLKRLREALRRSSSVVLQMPTGSGKTVTAGAFIRQEASLGPVWFVCHRREIIRQASKAFSNLGIRHDVIAPDPTGMDLGFGYTPGAAVKIASVQTITRRLAQHQPPRLVVWDECHHAAAGSWARLKESMPTALHVGLTATPERLDGKGLADWFDEIVVGPSIHDLIEEGQLSRLRIFAPTGPDLTKARIQMGDYRRDDADAIMNAPVIIGDAVCEYRRHADGSRAMVFATSVDASKKVADRFNADGIPAAHVDGTTPVAERDAAVAALASGRIKVLSNVEVFTEGVDVPEVDTVIILRPTRSLALYLQMVGRGMRVAPDKPRLTVLDHAGAVHEHGLPDFAWEWSLQGEARQRRLAAARRDGDLLRRCPTCSHVHAPTPTCEVCGFVYPTGRSAGQYDGSLYELTGGIPDGWENRKDFATRVGVTWAAVRKWVENGMPFDKGLVPVEAALEWLKSRDTRWKSYHPPLDAESPADYESKKDFANRVGVSRDRVRSAAEHHGLPCASNGWVHIRDGLAFWSEFAPQFEGAIAGYKFAALAGISATSLVDYIKRGLPAAPDGKVIPKDGLAWLAKHRRAAFDAPSNSEYESARRFTERLGVCRNLTAWRRRGLPCAPNGWVHIQTGLEWVRDNTKTVIPPEAWPQPDMQEAA